MTIVMDREFENLDSRLLDQFLDRLRSETEKAKLLMKTIKADDYVQRNIESFS